ncbi:MAG: 50S ribosomal protein L18 [Planctomycetes bacterium]|nr:50S ribosomal protein L18 [Planctomycetota bacterium]
MDKYTKKVAARSRRKKGIRKRIQGTPDRPRLTVFRSLKHIYVQVIDDYAGRTLVSASTRDVDGAAPGGNSTAAATVGKAVAERAMKAGVQKVVFDRNGFRFHGRIKALADAARTAGLQF